MFTCNTSDRSSFSRCFGACGAPTIDDDANGRRGHAASPAITRKAPLPTRKKAASGAVALYDKLIATNPGLERKGEGKSGEARNLPTALSL